MKSIILAGGCFWGVEAYFRLADGVMHTRVGYIDGRSEAPTYEEVCKGSGHAEAVYIEYDETMTDLYKILDHYFNIVDPTLINRQGPDIGVQYRSGIYNVDLADRKRLNQYLEAKQHKYQRPLQLTLKNEEPFYLAEEKHQNYLAKNPNGYCHVNLDSIRNIQE